MRARSCSRRSKPQRRSAQRRAPSASAWVESSARPAATSRICARVRRLRAIEHESFGTPSSAPMSGKAKASCIPAKRLRSTPRVLRAPRLDIPQRGAIRDVACKLAVVERERLVRHQSRRGACSRPIARADRSRRSARIRSTALTIPARHQRDDRRIARRRDTAARFARPARGPA